MEGRALFSKHSTNNSMATRQCSLKDPKIVKQQIAAFEIIITNRSISTTIQQISSTIMKLFLLTAAAVLASTQAVYYGSPDYSVTEVSG